MTNQEEPIPNGCIYKDHEGNCSFFWIIKGIVPKGSHAVSFGTSLNEHLHDLTTREVQFVHAIISPIEGIDATKLTFQKYNDFTKVNFHLSFHERIPLTRKDGTLITIMDVAIEGPEILIDLVHKHMEKTYNESVCSG